MYNNEINYREAKIYNFPIECFRVCDLSCRNRLNSFSGSFKYAVEGMKFKLCCQDQKLKHQLMQTVLMHCLYLYLRKVMHQNLYINGIIMSQ